MPRAKKNRRLVSSIVANTRWSHHSVVGQARKAGAEVSFANIAGIDFICDDYTAMLVVPEATMARGERHLVEVLDPLQDYPAALVFLYRTAVTEDSFLMWQHEVVVSRGWQCLLVTCEDDICSHLLSLCRITQGQLGSLGLVVTKKQRLSTLDAGDDDDDDHIPVVAGQSDTTNATNTATTSGEVVYDKALAEIAGLSLHKAQRLLQRFGSIEVIANTSIWDLSDTPGLSDDVARKIYDFFHTRDVPGESTSSTAPRLTPGSIPADHVVGLSQRDIRPPSFSTANPAPLPRHDLGDNHANKVGTDQGKGRAKGKGNGTAGVGSSKENRPIAGLVKRKPRAQQTLSQMFKPK